MTKQTVGWSHWWFEQDFSGRAYYFRLSFLTTVFFFYLYRFFDFKFLYSEKGLLLTSQIQSLLPSSHSFPFFVFPSDPDVGKVLLLVFLAGVVFGLLGFLPRACYLVLLFLHLLFFHRAFPAIYGADYLVSIGLFILLWSGTGRGQSQLISVGVRFAQIQICVLYLFSGLQKAMSEAWWSGEALWMVLQNPDFSWIQFKFLSQAPVFILFFTWLVIIFEVSFSAGVWGRYRNWFLGLGVLFHVSIALLLQLWFFSFLILSFYFFYFDLYFSRSHLRS